MPDYSIFEPLSKELNVSINELMCGEKVDEVKYQEKFEENVVNSIASIERKSKLWFNLIIVVVSLVVFFLGSMILLNTVQIKLKYADYKVKYVFINIIDILNGYHLIYAADKASILYLEESFNVNFIDGVYKEDFIVLRKEIKNFLKTYGKGSEKNGEK